MKIISIFLAAIILSNVTHAQTVEALGVPIKTSNVLWQIHPGNDPINNRLFPYFVRKSNGQDVDLMFDLKNINDNGIATTKFSLVTVNTSTHNFKFNNFIPQPGVTAPLSYGNPWTRFEGPDKKFYITTADGGGQFLQYDLDTEEGKDFGTPFTIGNKVYGIYSLAIGADSAIYGGSFSHGMGNTFTFRFDPKTNAFWKYLQPIDANLQYVTYVGGDSIANYAICGQSTWRVYSINRNTNAVKLLLSSPNRIYGIRNTACGCYTTVDGISYKLSPDSAVQSTPLTTCPLIDFTISYNDTLVPQAMWDEVNRTFFYKYKNGPQQQMFLDVPVQAKRIKYLVNYKDSLIVGNGSSYSYTMDYIAGSSIPPKIVGNNTTISLHSMLYNNNKIYMGGYPSGTLKEWDPSKAWTWGTQTPSYTPPAIHSTQSNSRLIANFRPDNFGIHELHLAGTTSDGYLIVTGGNIRTDTSISFGTYKDGATQQLIDPVRFADYIVCGQTISTSNKTAYVLAKKKDSWHHWVYEYDPSVNNVVDSFTLLSTPINSFGEMIMLPSEELFGSYQALDGITYLFTFDVVKKAITWQQAIISSSACFYKLGTDGQVWYSTTPYSPGTTLLKKYNSYTRAITNGPTFQNPDSNFTYNVSDMAFCKKDVYIGGFQNLIRIKDAIEPIPANADHEQKLSWLINNYKKVDVPCK